MISDYKKRIELTNLYLFKVVLLPVPEQISIILYTLKANTS